MKKENEYSIVVSNDIDRHISSVFKKLRDILYALDSGTLTYHYGGRPVRAQKIDIVRVISQTQFNNNVELGIRNIILEGVVSGESFAIGAGYLSLKMLLEKKEYQFNNSKIRSEKKDVNKCLTELMRVGLSRKIIDTIISNSSIDSEVILDTSAMAFQPVMRSMPSMTVQAQLHELFSTNKKSIEGSGLIVIDGIVESLGEIESILQSFSKDKKSLVMITRGYSPDVVTTLSKNYRMSNLFIFPFVLIGDEKVFEKLENIENFYNIQNISLTKQLSSSDFEFNRNFYFSNNSLEITGLDSVGRRAYVTLPSHYKNVMGILNDRSKLGMRLAKEVARSGITTCDHLDASYSIHAAKISKKVYRSISTSINELKCAVLQEG